MKKNLKLLALTGLLSIVVSANSLGSTLKVGATPVPHSEILEIVKPELAKEGIELEIVEFTDYVTPNIALNDGDLDANFFQHSPYLKKFAEERNLDIASAGAIHVEPLGLFSSKHKSLDELEKGSVVAIPNDPANGGRALILLHNNGIIKLSNPQNLYSTEFDVVENPKKIKFKSLEAAQLPRVLRDVDFAIINGNYAIEANLNPSKDALLLEGKESPYANVIAVKTKDLNKEEVKSLVKALQSEKVADFIKEKYNGAVVKAF
ncbi:MetQ/NlpA family ABC transporter substrate-binding protein [Fusobacterium sp.]|uniref:MetQ/NlpA family ABC transporter substrate-binding protein n=1 Tax=Fusobacterium sp. TaxID=68766 RepID=UPI0026016330|nr:MetQ/NlpA family ABC transporter substrate-binding protein [Fusobacterium sp.]